ncbi:hypothetical protein HK102_004251 [Quaeritorhiza haematococci]|nr:hypothetical protein HK102_004251 [Quaeritorhiza haematococci]
MVEHVNQWRAQARTALQVEGGGSAFDHSPSKRSPTTPENPEVEQQKQLERQLEKIIDLIKVAKGFDVEVDEVEQMELRIRETQWGWKVDELVALAFGKDGQGHDATTTGEVDNVAKVKKPRKKGARSSTAKNGIDDDTSIDPKEVENAFLKRLLASPTTSMDGDDPMDVDEATNAGPPPKKIELEYILTLLDEGWRLGLRSSDNPYLIRLRKLKSIGDEWKLRATALLKQRAMTMSDMIEVLDVDFGKTPIVGELYDEVEGILRKFGGWRERARRVLGLKDDDDDDEGEDSNAGGVMNVSEDTKPSFSVLRDLLKELDSLPVGRVEESNMAMQYAKKVEDWTVRCKKLFIKATAPKPTLEILEEAFENVRICMNEDRVGASNGMGGGVAAGSGGLNGESSADGNGQKTPQVKVEAEDAIRAVKKNAKFCICRSPEEGFMIQCDLCSEWYHLGCMRITRKEARQQTRYICSICDAVNLPLRPITGKKRPPIETLTQLAQEGRANLKFIPEELETLERIIATIDRWRTDVRTFLGSIRDVKAVQKFATVGEGQMVKQEVDEAILKRLRTYLRCAEGLCIQIKDESSLLRDKMMSCVVLPVSAVPEEQSQPITTTRDPPVNVAPPSNPLPVPSSASEFAAGAKRKHDDEGDLNSTSAKKVSLSTSSATSHPPPRPQSVSLSAATDPPRAENKEREQRFCLCREVYDTSSKPMIGCDTCGEWYHFNCVKLDQAQANALDTYKCPICTGKMPAPAWHPKRNPNANTGNTASQSTSHTTSSTTTGTSKKLTIKLSLGRSNSASSSASTSPSGSSGNSRVSSANSSTQSTPAPTSDGVAAPPVKRGRGRPRKIRPASEGVPKESVSKKKKAKGTSSAAAAPAPVPPQPSVMNGSSGTTATSMTAAPSAVPSVAGAAHAIVPPSVPPVLFAQGSMTGRPHPTVMNGAGAMPATCIPPGPPPSTVGSVP